MWNEMAGILLSHTGIFARHQENAYDTSCCSSESLQFCGGSYEDPIIEGLMSGSFVCNLLVFAFSSRAFINISQASVSWLSFYVGTTCLDCINCKNKNVGSSDSTGKCVTHQISSFGLPFMFSCYKSLLNKFPSIILLEINLMVFNFHYELN